MDELFRVVKNTKEIEALARMNPGDILVRKAEPGEHKNPHFTHTIIVATEPEEFVSFGVTEAEVELVKQALFDAVERIQSILNIVKSWKQPNIIVI